MDDILRRLSELWAPGWKGVIGVIDILLVALLIYRLLKMVRGTRAWKVLIGILVFVLALFLSEKLQLRTLHWVLEKASVLAPVALVILLLPELRQAIEGFAKLGLWPERLLTGESPFAEGIQNEIVTAAAAMSAQRIGAIILIERTERLDEIAQTGVPLNAQVTAALLEAIFYHGNPLHDGAAVVRRDKVLAAGCRLPLSDNPAIASHYHMRHRAGLGITEASDCVAVIVSEERGKITVATHGQMKTLNDPEELRGELAELLSSSSQATGARSVFRRRKPAEEAAKLP